MDGNKISIDFIHAASGLMQKSDSLKGFVIAGADKKFFFANAVIKNNTVVVSSPNVHQAVAVRYGWADFPAVNLFNKEGIPASPFRTDDWDVSK